MTDAVVIGAGPNGLVAATLLADHGWSVQLFEAADQVGGACKSAEVTAPGFVSDLFSAFYPLAYASPVLTSLDLVAHGLRWSRAPAVLAHPLLAGPAALLAAASSHTAAELEARCPGDGDSWRALCEQWQTVADPLLHALVSPFPPVRHALRLARRLGSADALRLARVATLPARRFAEEQFSGPAGGLLIAGNALHTDLGPDSAGSALFGWLLAMTGQDVGFPVPVGGSGRLAAALASRARQAGVVIHTGVPVERVVLRRGTAVGVRLADGTEVAAGKAVLAAVDAPQLYLRLVGADALPALLRADLRRFQWDNSTLKVDWALSAPIPWADQRCAGAGTVHLGGSMDELSVTAGQLARRLVPAHPFIVLGQMSTADPSRSPAGTESAWGYLHVPQRPVGDAGEEGVRGTFDEPDTDLLVARMERDIEAYAPGFRQLIVGRYVQSPRSLADHDRALHGGALNGGTAAPHQQLMFRPVPGLGRSETVIDRLFLASMSAHPGGGVHGGAGAIAARAALTADGVLGPVHRRLVAGAHRAIYRG